MSSWFRPGVLLDSNSDVRQQEERSDYRQRERHPEAQKLQALIFGCFEQYIDRVFHDWEKYLEHMLLSMLKREQSMG